MHSWYPKKCIEKHCNNFLQHKTSEREEAKTEFQGLTQQYPTEKNMLMPGTTKNGR